MCKLKCSLSSECYNLHVMTSKYQLLVPFHDDNESRVILFFQGVKVNYQLIISLMKKSEVTLNQDILLRVEIIMSRHPRQLGIFLLIEQK